MQGEDGARRVQPPPPPLPPPPLFGRVVCIVRLGWVVGTPASVPLAPRPPSIIIDCSVYSLTFEPWVRKVHSVPRRLHGGTVLVGDRRGRPFFGRPNGIPLGRAYALPWESICSPLGDRLVSRGRAFGLPGRPSGLPCPLICVGSGVGGGVNFWGCVCYKIHF